MSIAFNTSEIVPCNLNCLGCGMGIEQYPAQAMRLVLDERKEIPPMSTF